MAGLEAAGRHDICLVAQLELEKTQGPLQHQVGAVVEGLQRRLDRVPADQDEAGAKEVVWKFWWPGRAVVRSSTRRAAGEDLLKLVQEGGRRRFGLPKVLAREDRLRTVDRLGRRVGAV